ncbi:MAG: D-alanine--D-alanine ligase [Bacteroidales bacterium]|jgi:D-alanine-D-alanine ligase|nr:D-alanine--D-alanine ligase [Bacteroidales bacterium]
MKLKVAIIFGGRSAEHEISLISATNIYHAVDKAVYEPVLLGVDKNNRWYYHADYASVEVDLAKSSYFDGASPVYLKSEEGKFSLTDAQNHKTLNTFDVAFPVIHGTFGEDGTLQGVLKALDIPFVGPDVLGSAVAMDKDLTKRLLRDAGIPVADFFTLHRHHPTAHTYEEIKEKLGLPLFVKPANAGSSVGVSKVTDKTSFEAAVAEAFRFDNKILIEEAVIGKEVECAVLGNEYPEPSVLGEITASKDLYSYDAKYLSADGAKLKIPAEILETVSDSIRAIAVKAYQAISCEGMSRVDFLLREDGTFVLNEINTLPGFTSISMYPKLWEQTGISYKDLITKLIHFAIARHDRDTQLLKKL